MVELTTCLWLDGKAREAATFYTSIFPDSRLKDNWIAPTDTPGNRQGEEIVVEFEMFGRPFIALNGGPQFKFNEAISLQIPCNNQEEIDTYWRLLTENGGQESQCGWLKDRFGLSWQVTSPEMNKYINGPEAEGAKRATEAMLKMRKIDLKELERAYIGAKP
ncbi:MAG: VOC family protein [Candidatus Nanopelagicaceae bacterium]